MERSFLVESMDTGPEDFVFVSNNDTEDGWIHDTKIQRFIRKQAFDRSRNQKYLDNVSRAAQRQVSQPKERTLRESVGRFRLKGDSRGYIRHHMSKPLSPFAPTVEVLGQDVWEILNYCIYS